MNWDAVGAIAEALGAVGVIATLLYLASQIRQNNALLTSESRQAAMSNDQSLIVSSLAHSDLFQKMSNREELSFTDQYRLSLLFIMNLRSREHEYIQYLNGTLDEQTWKTYQRAILYDFTSKHGRNWWEKVGRNLLADSNLIEIVDDLLKTVPDRDLTEVLGSWNSD